MFDCIKTAPTARREESVIREKGQDMLGMQRTGVEEKSAYKESKAFCWRVVQDQG